MKPTASKGKKVIDLPPVVEIVTHVASYHADRKGYNERNSGIGLRLKHPDPKKHYIFGTFRNSMFNQSYYAGVNTTVWHGGPVSVGYTWGGVVGYSVPVMPLLLPEARLTYGRASLIVNWLPPIDRIPQVFGFTLGYKF
jgi:hypothetical protein